MNRRTIALARGGSQPIALTAATLLILVTSVVSITAWRAYTGAGPETDRTVAARQLQARTAQASAAASEQLIEKTRGLEATQQEAIDQLQVTQDQLATVKRLLAAQQADTNRLSEQLTALTESVDGLRQSYASTQATEPETPAASRRSSGRHRAHADARRRSKPRT